MNLNRLKYLFKKYPKVEIIGLTRIRNEGLVIQDSLNSMAKIVDKIIVFDDASTDNTVDICRNHPKVVEIIENKNWDSSHRDSEETSHRSQLLSAAKKYSPKWIVYLDADERLEGPIRKFLKSPISNNIQAIKIKLYDAYITPKDKKPYFKGKLQNFRKLFGPECREILMIWRNHHSVKFQGLDIREPIVKGKIITKFFCQHYGKALSIQHWEDTCNYYANYFPKYSKKWKLRRGKAIHTRSDFGAKLYTWRELKK